VAVAAEVEDNDFLLLFLLAVQGLVDRRPNGMGGLRRGDDPYMTSPPPPDFHHKRSSKRFLKNLSLYTMSKRSVSSFFGLNQLYINIDKKASLRV
jgi:hypothetical protein